MQESRQAETRWTGKASVIPIESAASGKALSHGLREDRGNETAGRAVSMAGRNLPMGLIGESVPPSGAEAYAHRILELMEPRAEWSVLFMGGTGGVLPAMTVELVRHVALSRASSEAGPSGEFRDPLLPARFHIVDDGTDRIDAGEYDVIVTSDRSLYRNPPHSLMDLDKGARSKVFVSAWVGAGPYDLHVYEAGGRTFHGGPSFTSTYYDMIHRYLGILANIAFVREDCPNGWSNREEALEAQKWMFGDMTASEEGRVRQYLDDHLVRSDGLWRLPYQRTCLWAIMWWEKKSDMSRPGRKRKPFNGAGAQDSRKIRLLKNK